MRALSKWSARSLSRTVPRPCQGEPSRRIANLPFGCGLLLEEARVDRVKARIVDREARQRTIRRDDRPRRLGAYVVIGGKAVGLLRGLLDVENPRNGAKSRRQLLAGRCGSLDVHHKAGAENLAREFAHCPH